SYVDAQKGLFYVNKPVSELAYWQPEEVIYLLYYGKQGTEAEVKAFAKDLAKRGACSSEVIEHIGKLPRSGHPMKLFSAAFLILGMFEGKNDYREDGLNLIAKIPHLTALVINHHAGWGETPLPRSDLGYMENFAAMLRVPQVKEGSL